MPSKSTFFCQWRLEVVHEKWHLGLDIWLLTIIEYIAFYVFHTFQFFNGPAEISTNVIS